MNPAQAVLILSLLSVVTTACGVLLAALVRKNAEAIAGGIGFSAGMMILIAAFELVPEAYPALGWAAALLTAASGAALLWIVNLTIPHSHLVLEHGYADTRLVKAVYLVVIGLILHDVPEGFAMANAYIASPALGWLVAIAIALHNLPEELAMALPAIALKSRRFLLWAAALSALAEPAGAVIGLLALELIPQLNGYFMAFAAGAMIFVALHELFPMAQRYGHLGWFCGGLAVSVAAYRMLAWATEAWAG
ncbi:MAG TPA: ZIP family metal transporter [Methylocella sp.]|nr:ZIP family metal transporter [Methylocella sp.]